MKRAFIIVAICFSVASVCVAQQNPADAPASKEDVERYFEVMHVLDIAKNSMDLMRKQVAKLVHEQMKNQPSLPPEFEDRMNKKIDDMWKDFPLEEMLQAMIPAYQHNLTKGDIDALIAFYSSPAGQRIMKQLPAIQAEALQAAMGPAQKYMAKAMDRIHEDIAQAVKEDSGTSKKPQSN